ncbi:MAG: hypothetical protein KAG94_06590 [Clostridiales bacterium]|nr:hypothetical protein [Clostridiales bacterium]
MDYFTTRVALLKQLSADNINKEFIDKLLLLLEDMAVMLDDCVDSVDDIDDRLTGIEQTGE